MSKIPELRAKYGKGVKYEPVKDCKKCSGTGEVIKTIRGDETKFPCLCIYVSPKNVDIARETLGKTVKKIREELKEKNP